MNKLSIKTRVTLWYALLMIFVVGIVLSAIFYISNTILTSSIENRLFEVVESSLQQLEYDGDSFSFVDEHILSEDNISLSFYTTEGHFIDGSTPPELTYDIVFIPGEIQTVNNEAGNWAVYDRLLYIEGYGNAWVRGISSFSEPESTMQTLIYVSLVLLPFMVLVAVIGGYWITKRAFIPVKVITDSAEQITDGNDLSQRIDLGNGKDEIYTLANTFDRMFDRLEKSFEVEKQFTSDASHELRTPIAVIISQCEYALESSESPEEMIHALKVILGQSNKMSKLIAQLLFLSRMDHDTQSIHVEKINLTALTQVVIEEQEILARDKEITIEANLAPNLSIEADETLIMSLLINLISNAIKYGNQGGKVWVELKESSSEIIGVVRDNGVGISENNMQQIWTRFYQVDASRSSSNGKGIGLGLSMVHWIIEAHHGHISVESKLGEGSAFTFQLPKKQK